MRTFRMIVLAVLAFAVTALPASALDIEDDFQPPPGEAGHAVQFEFVARKDACRTGSPTSTAPCHLGYGSPTDGKLTGTPTEVGHFTFWVALDDNSGPTNPFCQVPSTQSQGDSSR